MLNNNKQIIFFANYLSRVIFKWVNKITINQCDNTINIYIKKREDIQKLIFFLKYHTNCQYNTVSDICGVDFLGITGYKKRFQVIYSLLSVRFGSRIRVIVELNEFESVFTVSRIFEVANWYEREVWDLFGIYFLEHPDLRRILTDYGFEGFPLRKDFPISGYTEIRYDDSKKRLVYEPLEVAQEFRFFNFNSPWEQVNNLY